MRFRWTAPAARGDLYSITEYVRQDNAGAATRVLNSIRRRCNQLLFTPQLGHPGKEPGTRELVLSPLPCIVVYRLHNKYVEILRIWPRRPKLLTPPTAAAAKSYPTTAQ
jgi:toxin ParE1/3/4